MELVLVYMQGNNILSMSILRRQNLVKLLLLLSYEQDLTRFPSKLFVISRNQYDMSKTTSQVVE